jgi:hypothetical protein
MKTILFVLWTGLLASTFAPARPQEPEKKKKKAENPVTRFFQQEGERLEGAVEGSWLLFDYVDPVVSSLDGTPTGFATFHEGVVSMTISVDTAERRLFRLREFQLVQSGVYRYRFDEQANLQLAAVMSFSNASEDGEMERLPAGLAMEYFSKLEDDVLELRNSEGVTLSFRKFTAGDFPDSAIRKLEARRSGTPQWEGPGPDTPR